MRTRGYRRSAADCSTKWYNISEDREQRRKKKPVGPVAGPGPGPVVVATVIPSTSHSDYHEEENNDESTADGERLNNSSDAAAAAAVAVSGAAGRIGGAQSERGVSEGTTTAGVLQQKRKRMRRADIKQLAQEASKAGKSDDIFEYEAQQGIRSYPTMHTESTNPPVTHQTTSHPTASHSTTSTNDTTNQINHDQEHVGSSSSSGGPRSLLSTSDIADLSSPQALMTTNDSGNHSQAKKSSNIRPLSTSGLDDESPSRITRTRGFIEENKIMTRALAATKPSAADLWKATYVHNLGKTVRAAQNGNGKGATKGKGKGGSAVSNALAPAVASLPKKGSKSGASSGTAVQVGGMVAGLVGGRVKMMSAVDQRRINSTGNHSKTTAKNSSKGRNSSGYGAEIDGSGGSDPSQQSQRRSNSDDIALLLDHQRELGLMDIDDLYDHEVNDEEDADDGFDDYAADLADDEDGDYN